MRWGWFASGTPTAYAGLGYPDFAEYDSGRGVEQLAGVLPPLAVGVNGCYVLDQAAAPDRQAGRKWAGASGTAVFCEGLLVGVVVADDEDFGNRRLHAVPAHLLVADPEFARLVAEDSDQLPLLEAVELKPFLQPPTVLATACTPGSLLAAAAESIDFVGRHSELQNLASWRDRPERFSVLLVTGEGGQGKTRLARQFAIASCQAGWVAGFLSPGPAMIVQQPNTSRQIRIRELTLRLTANIRPVLIIADYADTRPGDIEAIAGELADTMPASSPVRLVLLSRAAGSWWHNLSAMLGPRVTHQMELTELTSNDWSRREAYSAAVAGFARRLALLPEPPLEEEMTQGWPVLAEYLAVNPPRLDDPRLGNVLTLHITALTDLLAIASGRAPVRLGEPVEQELVRHERGYLRRAAVKRGLMRAHELSDCTDDHDRTLEVWARLERALAGIILLGSRDPEQAVAVGALASAKRAKDVSAWLASLYPPIGTDAAVGTVQPDRLAELLLGPILTADSTVLCDIADLAISLDDAYFMLSVLMRTATHPDFTSISEQAQELIIARPTPFAMVAPVVAVTIPQSPSMREGLVRLGLYNKEEFRKNAYVTVDQLPMESVNTASLRAALLHVLTDVMRTLAAADPAAYLLALAATLHNLALALSIAGQRRAALSYAEEAVNIYRETAEEGPDNINFLAAALDNLIVRKSEVGQGSEVIALTQEVVKLRRTLANNNQEADQQAQLAITLNNFALLLLETGQLHEAMTSADEAVEVRRILADKDPETYLPHLAAGLDTLANALREVGRPEAAFPHAEEAVAIRRRLANGDPDTRLPDLALSLRTLAMVLQSLGQPLVALAPAHEAAVLYQALAEVNAAAFLPQLAQSFRGLALVLSEIGQYETARIAIQDAVAIQRELARDDPEAYLADLAVYLDASVIYLTETENGLEALKAAQEAINITRRLADSNPKAYLAGLAGVLNNYSLMLAKTGKMEAALAPAQETSSIYRRLSTENPETYLPNVAMSLCNLALVLTNTGSADEALAPAQEAVHYYRTLARNQPRRYAPELAESLHALSRTLAAASKPQSALVPAEETVTLRVALANTNPGAFLKPLMLALNTFADTLAESGREGDIRSMWESSISDLHETSAQIYLTVCCAHCLVRHGSITEGIEMLATALGTPGIPDELQVVARQFLHEQWQGHPEIVEQAWRSTSNERLPGWGHEEDQHLGPADT